MGLLRVESGLANAPQIVYPRRHGLDVARIHTRADATFVIGLKAGWDWPVRLLKGDTMGLADFTIMPELTVSPRPCPNPDPAPRVGLELDLVPEPLR